VILKEINMIMDEPRNYQFILFQKTLFRNHPARYPGYGSPGTVSSITRKNILDYYRRHFVGSNTIIVVVGKLSKAFRKVSAAFSSLPKGRPSRRSFPEEPRQQIPRRTVERRPIRSAYLVFGHAAPRRAQGISYALDVLRSVFGRGQSGRMFDVIRNKHGLAYDVGIYYEPGLSYGIFSTYVNTAPKNIKRVVSLIRQQLDSVAALTSEEISEAKDFLEGEQALRYDDNLSLADDLAYWQLMGDARLHSSYIKKIRSITKKDLVLAARQYLGRNYSLAVISR